MTARSKTAKTRAAPPPKRARPKPTAKKVKDDPYLEGIMARGGLGGRPVSKPRRMAGTAPSGSYFVSGAEKAGLEFFSSGCAALDEILGGGWCLGRASNVVGDKSSGKTLLAIEAMVNFCMAFIDGVPRYAEAEAAFDMQHAKSLGAPMDRILFNGWRSTDEKKQPMRTVEDLYDDLVAFLDMHPGVPKLYIIDSLDSLSTEEEMEADFNAPSFGGGKPKAIGQLFRRLIERMENERCHFMVISQLRDKMNAKAFQETKSRSGGKALDFYASWILWLTEIGKITRELGGIKRTTGIDVMGHVRKLKVGLPYRKCTWPILFGYGIDDMKASVDYLIENKCEDRLLSVGLSKAGHGLVLQRLRDAGGEEALAMRRNLAVLVHQEYQRIETSFLPKASKYGG